MRIYNNPAAFNTWRQLSITDGMLSKNLEKLSSGMRINRAADDASGLATSEKMRNQISGLRQASINAQDGISMIQAADGALDVISNIFNRVRTRAVAGNNDTITGEERFYIALEIDQLFEEFQAIIGTGDPSDPETFVRGRAEFNTRALFAIGGGFGEDSGAEFENLIFQIGANVGQRMDLSRTNGGQDENPMMMFLENIRTLAEGDEDRFLFNGQLAVHDDVLWGFEDVEARDSIEHGFNVAIPDGNLDDAMFENIISEMDAFVGLLNSLRATLGAYQNRLEFTVRNLNTVTENTIIAESRIRDTDMVAEMSDFTRNNILLQSGTAMMAQANAKPQTVLRLLG